MRMPSKTLERHNGAIHVRDKCKNDAFPPLNYKSLAVAIPYKNDKFVNSPRLLPGTRRDLREIRIVAFLVLGGRCGGGQRRMCMCGCTAVRARSAWEVSSLSRRGGRTLGRPLPTGSGWPAFVHNYTPA